MENNGILIVEDEFIVGTSIRKIIEKQGFKAAALLASGEEAIQFCLEHAPDLVIMDITLRGKLNGIETARIIHDRYDIPIIFLTAHANDKLMENASSSEPFAYIIKPFEDTEIKAAVKMALVKHKLQQELHRNRKFLRLIIDNDPNLIFVKDEEGRYQLVNKSLAGLIGLTPKQMIGKTDKDLADELPASAMERLAVTSGYSLSGKGKERSFVPEVTITLPDGAEKWYQTNFVPFDTSGSKNGLLGVSTEITGRKRIELELQESYDKLKRILKATVNGLVSAVERRDPYTAGHQRRVGQLAAAIAEALDLGQDTVDGLYLSSLVHDVGKIFIPIEILTKPVKLSELEFSLIRNHPTAAYDILKTIEFSWPVANIVLQHHERLDGSGYPEGLRGDEIMPEAKILAVADVIEAMASHRPYRSALGIEKALREIEMNAGVLYDREIADCCLDLFRSGKFEFSDLA